MPDLDPFHITESLAYLRNTQTKVFGSDGHEFRLNPKLDDMTLARFEQSHRVTLPDDFRTFLTSVGNGGAGPFYGLFPPGKIDANFGLRTWEAHDMGVLSEPFPFEEEWNDLSAKPPDDLADRDEAEYWKQMEAFETTYWGTALVNGAFPICHQGCALRILLVVTGRQAGHLWEDRRGEYGGLRPVLLADGSPARFSKWYDEWLKGCLNNTNGTG